MIEVKVSRKTKGSGLDGIINGLVQAAGKGIETALENTANYAYRLKNVASGESNQGIKVEIVKVQNAEVGGRVYTDFFHAGFLEFGTGIYMDSESPGHISEKAAAGLPWFVHEDMADLSGYNFPVVETPEGDRYYMIRGTHPRPFMRPAAFAMRDNNIEAVAEAIRELIESVVNG